MCTPLGSCGAGSWAIPEWGRTEWARGQQSGRVEQMASKICYANQRNIWGQNFKHISPVILSSQVPALRVSSPRKVDMLMVRHFSAHTRMAAISCLLTIGLNNLKISSPRLLRYSLMPHLSSQAWSQLVSPSSPRAACCSPGTGAKGLLLPVSSDLTSKE